MPAKLPVAIIGAGPVGLAAATHLSLRGRMFVVLEAGPEPGHAVRLWSHVRLFSPWRWTIDDAARRLLGETGWQAPDAEALPTGGQLIKDYLAPLAAHPAIAPHLRLGARVTAVGRKNFDKMRTTGRQRAPFELHLADERTIEVGAVIDASGTWFQPNPIGAGGHPVPGEAEYQARINYGTPDALGVARHRYAGRRVLVVGSGHSAINTLLDLLELRAADAPTRLQWAMRRGNLAGVFGGGAADALAARGALGMRARGAVASGRVEVLSPFHIREIQGARDGLAVVGDLQGHAFETEVDEVVVATGFRPDLEMLRELWLELDPVLESARALGPLIDPNLHSCGTVRPHGAADLAHPEAGFYIVGAKSYGRAPTFLLPTGYEQVRSVAAALVGDHEGAARLELGLPQTGVCGGAAGECCGGPPPVGAAACCMRDADAKVAGLAACGCDTGC